MKVGCEVIQDLLPLYVDKLTSKESNNLVYTHLKECKICNQLHSEMAQDLNISSQIEVEPSEGMERQLVKRIKKKRLVNLSSLIIIFSLIGFVIGAYVIYSNNAVIKAVKPIALTNKNRNLQNNPAKEIQLKSSFWKQYKVDNKTFRPGYYDITALGGTVDIGSVHLKKGDQYLGVEFYSNNLISVKGNGTAKLTPAHFMKQSLKNGVYTLRNKSVIYKVGDEIEPGTYQLQVKNHSKNPFWVYAEIRNYDETGNSFDIRNSRVYTFTVKNGDMIKILNWSEDETDLTIKMKLLR